MAFDLEEQEQIENLKAFWKRWGWLLSGIVVLGAVAFLGLRGNDWYQARQMSQAAELFETHTQALTQKDGSDASLLSNLQSNFGKSRYAALASFNTAQTAVNAQAWDKATPPLQWIIEHSTVDNQAAARLMLADVLVQTQKNDDALKTLETVPTPEFTAAFANKKSDIYLTMNDTANARKSLEAAIKTVEAEGAQSKDLAKSLKQKLDFLPK